MSGPPAGATLRRWAREQAQLKASLIEEDTEEWQKDSSFAGLERVGGVDLSYVKGDDTNACASLVVLSYPDLEVLYEDCQMVAVTAPYVAGFLAFREVPFLVEAIQRLQQKEPRLKPQVLLVDGNGLLHHRGFGVACHLGVLTDLPCIGVAKNLLQVDGLARDELHREQIRSLQMEGDAFPLTGTSGKVLGMVLRSYNNSSKPLYISVGHRVCLETAVHLVKSCCRYRIPEPIRQGHPAVIDSGGPDPLRVQTGACSDVSVCSIALEHGVRIAAPQCLADRSVEFTDLRESKEELDENEQKADIRSREYIRKQLCSPLEVISSGPKRREKETEPDD